MSNVNMMVWGWLVGLGGMIISATVMIMRIIGYNAAWSASEKTDLTIKAAGAATLKAIDADWFDDAVVDAMMGVWFTLQYRGWMWAAWSAMTPEEQDAKIMAAEEQATLNKKEWAAKPAVAKEVEAEEAVEEDAEEGAEDAEEGAEDAEEGAEEGEEEAAKAE